MKYFYPLETYWIKHSLGHGSAITCLCFEITEKVGIGCIWWIIPWVSWRHCCAGFIAILTRGKNDLAFFVYFSLDQATFKIPQLFLFAQKQLETSWDDLSAVLFSMSSAVQWFLALDISFFLCHIALHLLYILRLSHFLHCFLPLFMDSALL